MVTVRRFDPVHSHYFQQASSDSSVLRVITWPRFAGKSALIGHEVQQRIDRPEIHSIIVHPNISEERAFFDEWLVELDAGSVTNCHYLELPSLLSERLNPAELGEVYVYFSEPDYYTSDEDPYLVLVDFMGYLGVSSASLTISGVTYIGTPFDGPHHPSTLARVSGAVDHVWTVHPRELSPDWRVRMSALEEVFDHAWVRSQFLGLA